MTILPELRHTAAPHAGHLLPLSLKLAQEMKTPAPAQAAARTTCINNGKPPILVEPHGGHDDVTPRLRVASIERVPRALLEEMRNGVGAHNLVRLVYVEPPL